MSVGDRRTKDTLLPNQRLCNAISASQMALIPFAPSERGFEVATLRAEVSAAEALIAAGRGIGSPRETARLHTTP
jgi:hypothetical protein